MLPDLFSKVVISIVSFIFTLLIGLFIVDSQVLIDVHENAILLDKWHEDQCSSLIDGNGNYIGDSCTDDWTVVYRKEDRSISQKELSNKQFRELKIGDNLDISCKVGRLGYVHDFQISKDN